jgi:hypothetical protein
MKVMSWGVSYGTSAMVAIYKTSVKASEQNPKIPLTTQILSLNTSLKPYNIPPPSPLLSTPIFPPY